MPDRLRILLIVIVAVGAICAVRMIHRKKLNLSYSLLWIAMAANLLKSNCHPIKNKFKKEVMACLKEVLIHRSSD